MTRIARTQYRAVLSCAAAVLLAGGVTAIALHADGGGSVRITSPLGRTGLPGTIRIVARVEGRQQADVRVHFFVDKQLLATDSDGSPFEALWNDENPFESREISVEAEFASGERVGDSVILPALEVIESADVASVAVDVSVVDRQGVAVTNLDPVDFRVTENEEPQSIDVVSHRRDPALFVLLVDSSQSMAVQADAVRTTASALLERLDDMDQVVVAPFSRGITSVTGPTADRATILDALRAVRHGGGTAILDSVGEAAAALKAPDRRRAIVLITDGYDEHSESELEAAVASLRSSDIRLYVVGVGGIAGISLKGEKLLSDLAAETGGRAWFPRSDRHLAQAYAAIATDVQHNYFLAYTPTNQRRDGTWRAIEVTVGRPEVQVRARRGYTAPTPAPVRASLEFTAVGDGDVPVSLAADDLVVVENGVEQSVDAFHDAVQPVTIMLALDSSGSMKRSTDAAQEAARQFVTAMRPEDRLGMILFSDKANYVHPPTWLRELSLKAIDGYVATGGTALYDAMYDSLEQVARSEGRRVVVVVTDGRDENAASNGPGSFHTWDDVLRLVRESEAAVYAVGLGSRVDRERLRRLTDVSGGVAYFPQDVTTLAADYAKILDELRRRYVIGYESTDRSRDGAWRTVEIESRRGGVHVRSRGGYYAPAQ